MEAISVMEEQIDGRWQKVADLLSASCCERTDHLIKHNNARTAYPLGIGK